MTNQNYRFDPLKVLDGDWRRRVWKRWLRSTIVEAVEAGAPTPTMEPSADAAAAAQASVGESSITGEAPQAARATLPPPPNASKPPPAPNGWEANREAAARRQDLRARFDALFDRMQSIEDTIDSLGKRFSLKALHERRQEQRLSERIESNVEMLERQTLALEATEAAIARIDQRLERLERRLRGETGNFDSVNLRQSLTVPSGFDVGDLAELEEAYAEEARIPTRSNPPESYETHHSTSSIHGNLAEMSLSTVLAMLELERRTGLLKVCAEDGSFITATLRHGSIVGASRRDLDADPVEVIREAMCFKQGHFWFQQLKVEVASGPPRSVGSVLLEASSRNDEAARTG
jgi:hypothetical protein